MIRGRSSTVSRCAISGMPATSSCPFTSRQSTRMDMCLWRSPPELAFDTAGTITRAKLLWEMVDRPNLLVKIPATKETLEAIEDSIAAGISVNVTLIFSLERYRAVAEAYIRGLERLVEGGGDPSKVASVASFFVSRVDTETDRRLEEVGREDLTGRLAIDNAKIVYQEFKTIFSGPEWESLEARGPRSSGRCGPRPRPRTRSTRTLSTWTT